MLKRLSKSLVFQVIFSGVVATLFVFLFSYSTSPLYGDYYGGDSAQFQTVGKIWSEGGVPYRDAFDHKGPIIFLANAIGYNITGDKTGVMIVQILCLFVTLLFLFKIFELANKRLLYGVIGVFLTLIFLTIFYTEGNMTEEYCLPFITVGIYGLSRYFVRHKKDNIIKHCPLWAGIYGLCFGICLMSQASNALPVGLGVLVITAFLIYKKQWKNLLQNIGACLVGISAVVLPFVIYFALNGAFGDFVYGTIGYNSEYATNMITWLSGVNGETLAQMSIVLFPSYMLLVVAYLAWRRGERLYSGFLIISGLVESVWFCTGASFAQYEMITVPQIALLLNELILAERKNSSEIQLLTTALLVVLTIICFNQAQLLLNTLPDNRVAFISGTESDRTISSLVNKIPKEDSADFIAYGENSLKTVYLKHNLTPAYKYFAIQDWHGRFSDKVRGDIYTTFAEGEVKWILSDGSAEIIKDVIDDRYELVDKSGDYSLYRSCGYDEKDSVVE